MDRRSPLVAAIALIGTPAFAADMGVAPTAPPAPVYNWIGWYAGVNAGASFGNVKTDFNVAPVFVSNILPEYPAGFIGGGQIGYNYQLSPIWVVGFEADFQGALEKDFNGFGPNFTVTGTTPVVVNGHRP